VKKNFAVKTITTPIGQIELKASEKGLRNLNFHPNLAPELETAAPEALANLMAAEIQLKEYFQGVRKDFDIPLDLEGNSEADQQWKLLKGIPYGQVKTFSDLPDPIQGPNPLPIIIPTHRVVKNTGEIQAAPQDAAKKEFLLKMEMEYDFYDL